MSCIHAILYRPCTAISAGPLLSTLTLEEEIRSIATQTKETLLLLDDPTTLSVAMRRLRVVFNNTEGALSLYPLLRRLSIGFPFTSQRMEVAMAVQLTCAIPFREIFTETGGT